MMDKKEATNMPTWKAREIPPLSLPIQNEEKFFQVALVERPSQSIPKAQ